MSRMVGVRHERLIVTEVLRATKQYKVRCDCGVEKLIAAGNLYKTASCGCYMKEAAEKRATHGFTKGSGQGVRRPAEYETWANMIQRCTNPNRAEYLYYGGRGIKVCERWRKFSNFFADMGPRPSSEHSIDRINNDGNYEPGNARWATREEQARNKSINVFVVVDGSTVVKSEAAQRYGINHGTFHSRIRRGWSGDDAVSRPIASRPPLNLVPGTRFGNLVVIALDGHPPELKNAHLYYAVTCDCGMVTRVRGSHLVDGRLVRCSRRCALRPPRADKGRKRGPQQRMRCRRCKRRVGTILDYLCLGCYREMVEPRDDRETQPIMITLEKK